MPCLAREPADGRKLFGSSVRDINGRLPHPWWWAVKEAKRALHHNSQTYTICWNSNLVDDISYRNMRIRTAFLNRNDIIFAINALEWSKVVGFDGYPMVLLIVVPVVSAELLLLFVDKSWRFEIFTSECKEGKIVKIFKSCSLSSSYPGTHQTTPRKLDRKEVGWLAVWILLYWKHLHLSDHFPVYISG